jgi:hypothetical protein
MQIQNNRSLKAKPAAFFGILRFNTVKQAAGSGFIGHFYDVPRFSLGSALNSLRLRIRTFLDRGLAKDFFAVL